ncbi:hypothetical protein [Variovorax boronicumulans]|uniref:hypothetical protein n=1 Tax=Variovorax boronicumulans TaxID=436515 RepID=UPI0012F97127|nr:hypothetical protein [Variovorax boronicumulans]
MAEGLDIPAWVQAVGSVLAIGAAVRISRAEDRRRLREAVAAAEVTGALVRSRLLDLRAALAKVRQEYTGIARSHDGILKFVAAANVVMATPVPSEEQLIRLTASPITGAAELAELVSRLERVRTLLPTIDWSSDMRGDSGPGPSATSGLMEDLSQIEKLAIEAHATLMRFSDSCQISRELRTEVRRDLSWRRHPVRAAKRAWSRVWP